MALDDPLGVIATGKNIGLEGGQLTDEVLDRLDVAHRSRRLLPPRTPEWCTKDCLTRCEDTVYQ